MKIVKTNLGKKAPPPQRGVSKALYETVETFSGPASFSDIWDLLPAAIDNSNQVGTKKKLGQVIKGMVYRGYLVHDEKTDRWTIAPLSYYQARQQYIHDLNTAHHDHTEKPKPPSAPDVSEKQSQRMWLVIGLCLGVLAGFGLGVAFSIATIGLLS